MHSFFLILESNNLTRGRHRHRRHRQRHRFNHTRETWLVAMSDGYNMVVWYNKYTNNTIPCFELTRMVRDWMAPTIQYWLMTLVGLR